MKRLSPPPVGVSDFTHSIWRNWFKHVYSPYEWQAPTFSNSWDNVGGNNYNAGYVKDAWNKVFLRGRIDTGASGNACFTLPEGFRPNGTMTFSCAGEAGGSPAVAYVSITSSGVVTPTISGASIQVSLDGICFIAEA